MFTQPAPAPTSPGLGDPAVSAVSASASSPTTRTSRLRGLSYLRNYTQTHLLSREHNNTSSTSSASTLQPPSSSSTRPPATLTRSVSYSPTGTSTAAAPSSTATTNTASSSSRTNRFSLLPTLSHPLGLPPLPSGGRTQDAAVATTSTATTTGLAPGSKRSAESSAIPPVLTTTSASGTTDSGVAPGSSQSLAVEEPTMTRTRSATTSDALGGSNVDVLPSIRFSTFYDPRATRPSLTFTPISRTLPTGNEVIRVGRYSERDSQPNVPQNVPSAAPVGFKSKVVSRRHCEFWYEGGKWYIKDVKSSSGTFLNHIRLSPPATESKPFPVNDGDIVQLGIDFKGGEEMIFRCVKMRLELNRGWQNKLNTFNMTTHKRLRNMTSSSGANGGSSSQTYSQDCSICLNSIAPCQCLFVAPCSHTWHYKCIRALLASPSYPIFICPNCRAAADLEAEVDDPEEWEQLESDDGGAEPTSQEGVSLIQNQLQATQEAQPRRSRDSQRSAVRPTAQQSTHFTNQELLSAAGGAAGADGDITMLLNTPPVSHQTTTTSAPAQQTDENGRPHVYHATSSPLPIPFTTATGMPQQQRATSVGPNGQSQGQGQGQRDTRTPSPTGAPVTNPHEGPITPRNDAGPWVFDGSGVRLSVDAPAGEGRRISSLEAAVAGAGGSGAADRDGDVEML
ncbi:E3 ubiquitin-protein ligase DMA2 [Diplogelasinospora grovesii]|uniref:RING-type E3 ubiquitin transferase n=1 Tax=Diplogelasinospora grovesii TaxID=303347 RepID=A0AAN6RZJ9_9PEZI|nr:E3 ubiquitin-protein ligase DMA2 [Diplogelasinospora grovesii]